MTRGWPLVWALAAAQLVSWGSIYYSFSLFVVPMESELGWSRASLNGALSLGLLVSRLVAYPIGARIDRHGGRAVMALGSLAAAVLFVAWSRADTLAAFYAIWLGLGLALAATLYEPVFAVVTRAFPEDYRTRITALTLVGGFASTVFIPLTQLFIAELGWRDALVALAACNALVAFPVHALLLRDGVRRGASDAAARAETQQSGDAALRRALHHPAFWALAVCFTGYYATFSAMTFHIIPLLAERHVPTAVIVAAIATIGPAQVAGRVVLLALGRRFSTALAGRIAFLGLPCSVLLLLLVPGSTSALFAFAAIYGAANGIVTIIRGTAVPDLLWREGYGAINGALTLPANVARAAAPFGAALIWSAAGSYQAVLWSILLGGILAAAAFSQAAALAEPRPG
jgi:predicted MFS family arabinose efflux permease